MPGTQYSLKNAICDDSEEERIILRSLLSKYLDIHNHIAEIDEYLSGEDFLSCDVSKYNLVVLDIFMDELNGIETALELRKAHPGVQIIFCSTSREFAADSYDVSALHYLIKPVNEEKLFNVLYRFFYAYEGCKTVTYKVSRLDEHILISDILYLESGKDHRTVIHSKSGDIVTRTPMSEFASQLETADFVKPIRFALINLDAVVTLPADEFRLVDGTTVPIARDKRNEMKQAYTNYKMKAMLKKGGMR